MPAGAKADELCGWCVQVKCGEVGQAAVGGPVFPTPPVAGSISSNETGPTSIGVSGSVTSPVSLDQVSSLLDVSVRSQAVEASAATGRTVSVDDILASLRQAIEGGT